MSEFTIVNGELKHYGVMGMKWGVRRARRKQAKQAYKKATNKAFSEYERSIKKIEQPYKRGQRLSDKDSAKEAAAETRFTNSVKKAKAEYKRAKKDKSRDLEIANRKYTKTSSQTNARILETSTGKAFVQDAIFGEARAVKYNSLRGSGVSRGKAAVKAMFGLSTKDQTLEIRSEREYDIRDTRRK